MWVTRAEPSRQGTRVRASNNDNLDVVWVHFSNEISQICEALFRAQILEAVKGPVFERLRVTVEAMLENHELSVVLRADHEWVEAGVRNSAPVLTADVDKDGALAVPVLITLPVALLISAVV